MATHARLKNELTEDKKYHNLMRLLNYVWQIVNKNLCLWHINPFSMETPLQVSPEKSMIVKVRVQSFCRFGSKTLDGQEILY